MDAARSFDLAPSPAAPPGRAVADADTPVFSALHTTDVDEARSFCRGLYYYPMKVQPAGSVEGFSFAGDVVRLGPITIGEISYGSDIELLSGDLETAYHVLAPLTGTLQSSHRDIVVAASPRRAAVFQPVGDITLAWPGDCRLLSVKVDRAALEQEIAIALGRHSGPPLSLGGSFDMMTGPGRSWASLVRLLYAELRNPDSLVQQPQMAHRWWQLVLSGLALTVEHSYRDDLAGGRSALRPRPVKRTLDAMHADPGHPFTAPQLAGIAGVGTRVLQEAFRRHVGMPPMTYLRELRLARVHDELSHSDPWQASVSEVACRWGFTHLGRFAGAYRARYGVTPSQTLRGQG
jgi:AraC-like DNA-binding protein